MAAREPAPVMLPGQDLATIDRAVGDAVLRPGRQVWWWGGFTIAVFFAGLFVLAVEYLLIAGVGIWGIDIPVAWGFAIANYVWWIGIASGGTIVSALFYLTQSEWRSAVNRIAESMTLFAAAAAGIMPILHLGRPSYFYWLFPIPNTMGLWPQFKSPLLWDFFAILAYVTSSVLFWFLGLLPDLAMVRDRATTRRSRLVYGILAMGWTGSHRQWRLHKTAYGLLAALMAPLVVSVHSIVGLDFSGGLLPGWHSTQFSPFFVFGAVLSGFATVLLLVVPLRRLYRLEAFITARHLDLLVVFMLLCSLLLAYAYLVDALLPFYGDDKFERATALHRFTGAWAWSFWGAVILNVLVPQLLWLRALRRRAWLVCLVAFGVVVGMWLERIMLVTSSLYEDFLPSSWGHYAGTLWDWLTLLGSVGMAAAGFFLFLRYLPVLAAYELKEMLPAPDRHGERGMSGLAAEFAAESALVGAASRLRAAGVRRVEAYTPYPVEALDDLLPRPPQVLPVLVFAAGMLGLAGGFLLQWYGQAVSYPLNIGGRPAASWPAFIPIAFEIAVLCAVVAAFIGFFAMARLPQPYQPIAALPGFDRATQDRFFLVVDDTDPVFGAADVELLLKEFPCRVVQWR